MSAGSLTMACVMLVSGQLPADVRPTNLRNFKVPIDLDSARRREIRELLLFSSDDQGRNWHQVAKAGPDATFFIFRAPADGLYYFRSAAINLQNKQDPENLFEGPPQLKILIDTRKPELQIVSARRDGEFLVVSWNGRDENADPNSLLLEYQLLDGSSPAWVPIQVTPAPTGEARARLTSPATVAVRMQLKDLAGNTTVATARVEGSGGLAPAAFSGSPPNPGGLPVPAAGSASGQPAKAAAEILPTPPSRALRDPVTQVNVPPPPAAAVQARAMKEAAGPIGNTSTALDRGHLHVANATPVRPQDIASPTNPAPAAPARRPPPEKQLVNDRTIVVEYELSRVGPSGIASVELFLSRDGGQTWKAYAKEGDENKGVLATTSGKYQRTLELPEGDGVYGLYLVVRNRAGRGKAPPRPGDAPEMLIEVDTTAPQAQLNLDPGVDPERRDALLLTWKASDRNLGKGPITLEWAEQRNGPWRPIGANLPNTGKYSWQVPPGVPVEAYLRLRVRDAAGNEAAAITEQPQIIDLTDPEGRLTTVRPAGRP